jgi:hypothetical protein
MIGTTGSADTGPRIRSAIFQIRLAFVFARARVVPHVGVHFVEATLTPQFRERTYGHAPPLRRFWLALVQPSIQLCLPCPCGMAPSREDDDHDPQRSAEQTVHAVRPTACQRHREAAPIISTPTRDAPFAAGDRHGDGAGFRLSGLPVTVLRTRRRSRCSFSYRRVRRRPLYGPTCCRTSWSVKSASRRSRTCGIARRA